MKVMSDRCNKSKDDDKKRMESLSCWHHSSPIDRLVSMRNNGANNGKKRTAAIVRQGSSIECHYSANLVDGQHEVAHQNGVEHHSASSRAAVLTIAQNIIAAMPDRIKVRIYLCKQRIQ